MNAPPPSTLMVSDPTHIDWGEAMERHRRWLSSIVHSRLSDRQAAEDVMQEVALAAIAQPSRPNDPNKIGPWLYRIALRKVINHHRTTGRRKRLIERAVNAGCVQEEATEAEPGQWLVEQESQSAAQQALQKLPPTYREILVLKYTENWGYQDLAKHLGVSVKTIEYRLLKARRALRGLLQKQEP